MAANITDYVALQNAKTETDMAFDDMIQNLKNAKDEIDRANEKAWKGESGAFFNATFNDIVDEINKERKRFNDEIANKLSIWYNSFDEDEKAEIQRTQNM